MFCEVKWFRVELSTFTFAITLPEKMSAKHYTEATPTDYDDFWTSTEEPSGGSTPQSEDPAVKPNYYRRGGLECYDVQKASMGLVKYQGYLEGCVQKYLWRWEQKNGKQDLEKALEYLVKLIETLD